MYPVVFFLELNPNGAVRFETRNDNVKAYVERNKFDSCSSGSQPGGSRCFSYEGEFVQTQNSFINSTNSNSGTSFSTSVSKKLNFRNHANETLVYNCGSSEQDCSKTTSMQFGFIFLNQCNITQNRVKDNNGGYSTSNIISNSYINCVNIIENNQTFREFNYHSAWDYYYIALKITSCNYIRNKSTNDYRHGFSYSSLIYTKTCHAFLNYCCIHENKVDYIFYIYHYYVTFENSTTDNNKTHAEYEGVIFKNTDISFENECSIFIIPTTDFVDSFKYKCPHSNLNNENAIENPINVRNHIKYFFLFMTTKRFKR